MAVADDLHFLTDCALSAETAGVYEAGVFGLLDQRLGFDVAAFIRNDGLSDLRPGFDARVVAAAQPRFGHYGAELAPVAERALANGGVAVDREVLGFSRLSRLACYDELIRPHHGYATALLYLTRRGEVNAALLVGRTRGGFAERELSYLKALRPTLALAEASVHPGMCHSALDVQSMQVLTPREREVLDYLRLGYTNAQIGMALGTRERTVRNQLSQVYRKLNVSGRAEAVALTARSASAASP